MKFEWILIKANCTGCGICDDVCPEDAINMTIETSYPEPIIGKCTGCMICYKQCPFDAIEIKKMVLEKVNL